MTTPIPVIIDCDPGIDDAVTLLLALASPELSLLGVTTVNGNKPLDMATANALRVLELAGASDISVHPGCTAPLLMPAAEESDYHGRDGLGDAGLAAPSTTPSPVHAVDFIIDTVMGAPPQSITLCAIGPLSNVALALAREPRLAERLKQLLVMGGEAFPADGARAEFNFRTDPAAAHMVLSSPARVTLFGLDVTRQAPIAAPLAVRLARASGRVAQVAAAMLEITTTRDGLVHDAMTVAHLISPGLFSGRAGRVAVEWRDPVREGRCAFTDAARGHHVVTGVDGDRLLDLLARRIAGLAP